LWRDIQDIKETYSETDFEDSTSPISGKYALEQTFTRIKWIQDTLHLMTKRLYL